MTVAIHTHKSYPNFTELSDRFVRSLREIFCARVADSVILANQRLENVIVRYGEGYEDTVAKNRDYLMSDGTVRTNPGRLNPKIVKSAGNIDPAVPVLYFESEDGKPLGAIVNYACHLDSVGTQLGYSGDYASLIAKDLKKEYGDNFISVFLMGSAGDINHVDVTRLFFDRAYEEMAEKLSPKIISAIKDAEVMKDAKLANCKECVLIKRSSSTEEEIKERVKTYLEMGTLWWITSLLNYHLSNKTEEAEIMMQCIKIGDALIFGLPGEVFVDIQLEIKNALPTKKNIFATLTNGSRGYIPTKDVFKNMYSYEGVPKYLEPEADDKIKAKALELAKKVGMK